MVREFVQWRDKKGDKNMKKILITLIDLVFITSVAQASPLGAKITYKESRYEYFVVAVGGSQGSINNLGEIVYMTDAGMFSTTRGRLTKASHDKRFPRINDSGEVVYCGAAESSGAGPWTVYSTIRGKIALGFSPSINNLGEIAYVDEQAYKPTINSTTRGTLVTINPGPAVYHSDINDSGEVVYKVNNQLFSTTRGLLATIKEGGQGGATINKSGDVLYSNERGIFYTDGTNLTTRLSNISKIVRFGGPVDVNDYGDFVFGLWFSGKDKSFLMLATQRPKYYKRKYKSWNKFSGHNIPPATVPLPFTKFLLDPGLTGLAWVRRNLQK